METGPLGILVCLLVSKIVVRYSCSTFRMSDLFSCLQLTATHQAPAVMEYVQRAPLMILLCVSVIRDNSVWGHVKEQ